MTKLTNRQLWNAGLAWGGDPTLLGAKEPKARKQAARNHPTEEQDQRAVILWWDGYAPSRGIDYRLLFAVPNGARLGRDSKSRMIEMGRLKATGLRPGVSDLVLAVPRPPFCGAFLEMKSIGGRESVEQTDFIALVQAQGYYGRVCYGADEAIGTITEYLKG